MTKQTIDPWAGRARDEGRGGGRGELPGLWECRQQRGEGGGDERGERALHDDDDDDDDDVGEWALRAQAGPEDLAAGQDERPLPGRDILWPK